MAKKIEIAISKALSVKVTSGTATSETFVHGAAPVHETFVHGAAPVAPNPLDLIAGGGAAAAPVELFTFVHGAASVMMPAQQVSRLEIHQDDNGDLTVTLLE
jgi:hypothetical protein